MQIRGVRELRRAGKWVRSQFVNGALILLYHRIADVGDTDETDPFGLCVAPQNFREHLAVLRQIACPILLRDMVHEVQSGSVPRRAVAVTFDDGYADNLYQAKPILEHFGVPATVFVTSGSIGKSFWWDDLAEMVHHSQNLPRELSLTINEDTQHWRMRDSDASTRQTLLVSLHRQLRTLAVEQSQPLIAKIAEQLNFKPNGQQTKRAMTADEIVQLTEKRLVDIGAHTVSHRPLASLPVVEQRYELTQSKKHLEEISGQPVMCFSYPYGLRSDYTPETVTLVLETGFECACTNDIDVVWYGSEPLELPRYWVRNWSGDEFGRRIKAWLGG